MLVTKPFPREEAMCDDGLRGDERKLSCFQDFEEAMCNNDGKE